MATNFPTSLDSLTNPTATSTLSSPSHSAQHADANDAIEALEAKVGVNNSAVTTSLDYRVRNPELVGGGARPLLTGGAYIDGTNGLVLSGLTGNYAQTPDSAALDITGDIEFVARVKFDDYSPTVTNGIIAKFDGPTGATRSYLFRVVSTAELNVAVGVSGSVRTFAVSTSGLVDGTTYWLKGTLDLDNGAGSAVARFYYAADQASEPTVWTQLGTDQTSAPAIASIDVGTFPVVVGSDNTASRAAKGTIYRTIIRDGIGGTVALDADFSAEAADTLAFTEDSTNAATVSVTTTRYTYGVPGVQANDTSSTAISPNFDRWQVFQVTRSIEVDMFMFDVITGPASNSTMYLGLYEATDDFQPTGAPVATASVVIPTSATGVFYAQITPVTLTPGAYVLGNNPTVQVSTRTIRGGISAVLGTYGASPFVTVGFRSRTAATFPTGVGVMTSLSGSSANMIHPILLRWKAA